MFKFQVCIILNCEKKKKIMDQMLSNIWFEWYLTYMLRAYITCNLMGRFSKYIVMLIF